jgi:hypothetical protein
VEVAVEIEAAHTADELRSLRDWLIAERRLRGQVRLIPRPSEAGSLGAAVELLTVALGPGGTATALATVLISWIRRRSGSVRAKVTKGDGTTVELTTTNTRGLTASEVQRMIDTLARDLDGTAGDGD